MAREPRKIKDDILFRVRVLYLLFIVAGLIILVRLLCVQFLSRDVKANARKLDSKIFAEKIIHAHRGTIFSRTGDPLAISIFRYTVMFDFGCEGFDNDQTFREQSDSLSKLLARFFKDRTAREYYDRMISERSKRFKVRYIKDTVVPRSEGFIARLFDRMHGEEFKTVKLYDTIRDHTPVRLFRDVDYNEWQTLKTYPLLNWNMGVVYDLDKHDNRVFPRNDLARVTIGRSSETAGEYGLEHVFREQLSGKDGLELRQRIAPGFWGRVDSKTNVDAEDGMDLYTTIDIDIQEVADKALREQLRRNGAKWGTTIVMEAETGDILAMVNLSRNSKGDYVENYNHALMSRAEPGSTFKLASLLALVDEAGLPLSTTYDSGHGKSVTVGKNTDVRDSHDCGGEIDMKTAVAQSANVYFAKAVYQTYLQDPDRFTDYLRRLHLDRKVMVSLPDMGEIVPRFPYRGSSLWYSNEALARYGYGYIIEVTPIQMATLYNAVANGGRMVAPRLVTELRKDDKTVREFPVEVLEEKICSRQSLEKVRECLEEVAISGTARDQLGEGKVPCSVGAKTGTAQFAQGPIKYSDHYYVGSMAAYFPADRPRYTIYTSILTNGANYYGTSLAGPVNRKVVTFIYNREHDWYGHVERASERQYPTAIKGGNIAQARKIADRFSPRTSFDRRAGWGTVRVDSTSRVNITSLPDDMLRMPDVVGMGLKDALFVLESRGLKVSFAGEGAVRSQSIRAGEPLRRGSTVYLKLK